MSSKVLLMGFWFICGLIGGYIGTWTISPVVQRNAVDGTRDTLLRKLNEVEIALQRERRLTVAIGQHIPIENADDLLRVSQWWYFVDEHAEDFYSKYSDPSEAIDSLFSAAADSTGCRRPRFAYPKVKRNSFTRGGNNE